jgi:D-glycero-D-manno-heptose 1,7-bisphosphate phosphatase
LRAFAVQVDGDVRLTRPDWKALIKPTQGQQLIAANQLNGVCQPFRARVEQTMVWKSPSERVQGGNGNQKIPEAEGAEYQKLRPGTVLFLVLTAHPPAFRPGPAEPGPCASSEAVSEDSIPVKCFVVCLGSAVRGNFVRMECSETPRLRAVLFDRDGTLVVDVPYNGDPGLVRAVPGAKVVLDSLRARGLAVGVLSNQSGVARGLLTEAEVASVNARVDELLGPFDVWEVCPHAEADGCACRKPAPGMVHSACRRLGVHTFEAALIGDIGSDVRAAEAAGAKGILVPTPATRAQEITEARLVARDLAGAVELLLEGS